VRERSELKGPLLGNLLCESDCSGPVLARCTRLEVLTHVFSYTPAVWVGLTQLHTLHGVDLTKVSIAAIAAALPKLHSLRVSYYAGGDPAAVAGFFTDVLPRLRLVHFEGKWPPEEAAAVTAPPLRQLPLLKELVWRERSPHPTVLRGFLGARPIVLHAPYELIAEGLPRATALQPRRRAACWHGRASCETFSGAAPHRLTSPTSREFCVRRRDCARFASSHSCAAMRLGSRRRPFRPARSSSTSSTLSFGI
jgi:hypothetical protein